MCILLNLLKFLRLLLLDAIFSSLDCFPFPVFLSLQMHLQQARTVIPGTVMLGHFTLADT